LLVLEIYYTLLFLSMSTNPKNKIFYELEIPHCTSTLLICIFCCTFTMSTTISLLSARIIQYSFSQHIYKVGILVETNIRLNYCAIFLCNTNSNHHFIVLQDQTISLRFHTNPILLCRINQYIATQEQVSPINVDTILFYEYSINFLVLYKRCCTDGTYHLGAESDGME